MADACERCGICAAECPAEAIRIDDLRIQAFSDRLTPVPVGDNARIFHPFSGRLLLQPVRGPRKRTGRHLRTEPSGKTFHR